MMKINLNTEREVHHPISGLEYFLAFVNTVAIVGLYFYYRSVN